MATVFKTLLNDDIVSTRTLLHESIPIPGTIFDGVYSDSNVKNYSHGRFQSLYDYPYLSSSANHILDITVGFAADSGLSGSDPSYVDISKKIQVYNQLAQVLVGHDVTGSILPFDQDGDILAGGVKLKECVFISFSRLLTKDEIKKSSVEIVIGQDVYGNVANTLATISDYGASDEYRTNSPAGEYGILYSGSNATGPCGLVFYQAGILVLNASAFVADPTNTLFQFNNEGKNLQKALQEDSIQDIADVIRYRIQSINFNNTVELNSTIYFCRINHNEFNYSSNPTYLSQSKIRVKQTSLDSPASYITTVGLYSSDNELLATAKLSEPLKKTPENEIILRVRLDY